MSEFSIEALDAAARGVSGKTQSTEPKKTKLFGQDTQNINPQLQAQPDISTQQASIFDPAVLDEQAKRVASQKGNVSNLAGDLFSAKQLGQGLAALGDVTVGGIIPSVAGAVTYAGARAVGKTPEQAGQLEQQVLGYTEKPFGRAFGVIETPGYKGEAVNQLMNFVGENANKGADWIAKQTGLPVTDVQNMLNTVMVGAAPTVGKAVGGELKMAGQAVKQGAQTVAQPIGEMATQFKEKLPKIRMEKAPAQPMVGMGAAEVNAARLRQERGNELLIPMGEDMTKSQITRNPADVTFERETAKSPEFGAPLQEKYALQNKKLQQNLQAEVDTTGAQMVGMDAPEFGKVLSDTFKTYRDARYQEVSDAYKAAQAAGETAQPVSYKAITDLIKKETEGRPTKKAQNPLYSIVEEELKANDPNGTGMISVNAMEDIRKLINEEADPAKKGSVRLGKQIKSQIDAATENAGGDLYKEARAKNRAFESEFEDQSIIRDINRLKKGTSDRVVPLENLADKLVFKSTGADVKAVFATLEKMGPEGQQIANELRGYAADKIRQEATKGVGRDIEGRPYVSTAALDKEIKALDKSGKLDFLFGAKQAERFRTLNEYTKDLQTVPQGTVNTSGTTATLLSALGEMAVQGMTTGVPAPVLTIANYGYKHHKANQKMKKVQEYANPGTKLSEMPKIDLRGMANKE